MGLSTFLVGGTPIQLRGLAWLALSESGRVGTGTITDDTGGGGTTVWTFGGTIPCRIDPIASVSESLVANRISDRSTHRIVVPPNTAVTTANRFSITGRGTYAITAVNDRTSELARFLEAVQVS